MNLFHREKHLPDEGEQLRAKNAELEAHVQRLREDLEFYRKQNERIAHDAAPAIKENAVLRYQLAKCQSDRQILEFHIQGSRAEALAALNLLRRLSPSAEASADLLEATLFFTYEAKLLKVFSPLISSLEAHAQFLWQQRHGQPWSFDAERWLILHTSSLLQALENRRQQAMQEAVHPADGLAAFDPDLGEIATQLGELLQSLPKES
ncbi:MAG TPA: hypothetical protein VFS50_13615 [Meiothermus sp.]|jgi:chromosome segregation ATPase|nr:hypothetical protein [Meiothermus sp.]